MSRHLRLEDKKFSRERALFPNRPRVKGMLYEQTLPWGRERWYANKRSIPESVELAAWTGTGARRIVRAFTRTYSCAELKAYETEGRKSCPHEAVWLPAIRPGCPTLPAYPFILFHDKTNPEHQKGLAAVLELIAAGLVSDESANALYWLGKATIVIR